MISHLEGSNLGCSPIPQIFKYGFLWMYHNCPNTRKVEKYEVT